MNDSIQATRVYQGPSLSDFARAAELDSKRGGQALLCVSGGRVRKIGAHAFTSAQTHRKTMAAFIDALKATGGDFSNMMAERLEQGGVKKLTQGMVKAIVAEHQRISAEIYKFEFGRGDDPKCSLSKAIEAFFQRRGGTPPEEGEVFILKQLLAEGLRKMQCYSQKEMFDAVSCGLVPPLRAATLAIERQAQTLLNDAEIENTARRQGISSLTLTEIKALREAVLQEMYAATTKDVAIRGGLSDDGVVGKLEQAISRFAQTQRLLSDETLASELITRGKTPTSDMCAALRAEILDHQGRLLKAEGITSLDDDGLEALRQDVTTLFLQRQVLLQGETLKAALLAKLSEKGVELPEAVVQATEKEARQRVQIWRQTHPDASCAEESEALRALGEAVVAEGAALAEFFTDQKEGSFKAAMQEWYAQNVSGEKGAWAAFAQQADWPMIEARVAQRLQDSGQLGLSREALSQGVRSGELLKPDPRAQEPDALALDTLKGAAQAKAFEDAFAADWSERLKSAMQACYEKAFPDAPEAWTAFSAKADWQAIGTRMRTRFLQGINETGSDPGKTSKAMQLPEQGKLIELMQPEFTALRDRARKAVFGESLTVDPCQTVLASGWETPWPFEKWKFNAAERLRFETAIMAAGAGGMQELSDEQIVKIRNDEISEFRGELETMLRGFLEDGESDLTLDKACEAWIKADQLSLSAEARQKSNAVIGPILASGAFAFRSRQELFDIVRQGKASAAIARQWVPIDAHIKDKVSLRINPAYTKVDIPDPNDKERGLLRQEIRKRLDEQSELGSKDLSKQARAAIMDEAVVDMVTLLKQIEIKLREQKLTPRESVLKRQQWRNELFDKVVTGEARLNGELWGKVDFSA